MRIEKIDTVSTVPNGHGLLFCRIETDEGHVGYGETYYIPGAAAAVIHEWMADRLLGANPLDIESHWRFLYERAMNFGGSGAELRALSAIDLALWDILGQVAGLPVWQILGGRVQPDIRIYNSSGGPGYGSLRVRGGSWPGYGAIGDPAPLNDYWRAVHEPEAYARELLEEGIGGAKMWTLDFAAHLPGGPSHLAQRDLKKGLEPFFRMREAAGPDFELILDGHGFFLLPAALQIAEALRGARPLCLEDVIRPDCVDTIRDFRTRSGLAIAASEMFATGEEFRLLLEKRAVDYVMIDPTWVGGITPTARLVDLARLYNLPVMIHDCTGPLSLLAGVHVGTARGNVAWQETLRSHIRVQYPKWCDWKPVINQGRISAPSGPGLGAVLDPALFCETCGLRTSRWNEN